MLDDKDCGSTQRIGRQSAISERTSSADIISKGTIEQGKEVKQQKEASEKWG